MPVSNNPPGRAVGEGAEPIRPPARPPQDEFYGHHGKLRYP